MITWIVLAFIVNLAIVVGFPDASIFYMSNVGLHLLLGLAFTRLELHRVIAFTAQNNLRSQRLLDRHRFRLEARSLESYRVNGIWIDEFQYALLKREWRAKTTAV